MTGMQEIGLLCRMLHEAVELVKEQAELLAMHGIRTSGGELEERRERLMREGETA